MCDVTIKSVDVEELFFLYNQMGKPVKKGEILSDLYHRTLNNPFDEEIVISKSEFHDFKYVESVLIKRIIRW